MFIVNSGLGRAAQGAGEAGGCAGRKGAQRSSARAPGPGTG